MTKYEFNVSFAEGLPSPVGSMNENGDDHAISLAELELLVSMKVGRSRTIAVSLFVMAFRAKSVIIGKLGFLL
jgi:hypothetical protein